MGYITDAQTRAQRRKSAWNLLLFLVGVCALGAFTFGAVFLAATVHGWAYPGQSFRQAEGFGPGLSAVASFLGAIPLALVSANALVWRVPPARRALNIEAEGHPKLSYRKSQAALMKFAAVLVPVALVAVVLGALVPW